MSDTSYDGGVDATDLDHLRARTRALCARFPDEYRRETDLRAAIRRSSSTP